LAGSLLTTVASPGAETARPFQARLVDPNAYFFPPRVFCLNRYKLDTTFLHLPASEVLDKLQANLAKLRATKDALEAEADEIEDKMKDLKAVLYAKFGGESPALACLCLVALPRGGPLRLSADGCDGWWVAQRASTLSGREGPACEADTHALYIVNNIPAQNVKPTCNSGGETK